MRTYKIKAIGPHDGYKGMEKDLIGLQVIPADNKEPKYRRDPETVILRKGAAPTVIREAGTFHGVFAIPELEILSTKFDEVYLVISDGDKIIEEPAVPTSVAAIENEIHVLLKKLEEVKGGKPVIVDPSVKIPTEDLQPGEIKPLVAKGSMGVMIVEDESALPKSAVKPGFYQVDEDGNPDPAKPGVEPGFEPVSAEEKRAKFDKADEVAREKQEERDAQAMKDKMAAVRAAKGKK